MAKMGDNDISTILKELCMSKALTDQVIDMFHRQNVSHLQYIDTVLANVDKRPIVTSWHHMRFTF